MTRLIAGPWIGEFGWELFLWNGYIRGISKNFKNTICIGRPSSKYLYQDFCNKYIEINLPMFGSNMWMLNDETPDLNFLKKSLKVNKSDFVVLPNNFFNRHPSKVSFKSPAIINKASVFPKYIRFGKNSSSRDKIIFHARLRKDVRPKDNWEVKKWELLYRKIQDKADVYSIGTKDSSMHVSGTIDARGLSLEKQCDVISGSKAIVGPSSGPMHLGSLCGVPQIVWSDNLKNKHRYEHNWNPFLTNVYFINENNPHISTIYERILTLFAKK